MPPSFCPHLVTFDSNYNQGPAVDYPSFENRCLANGESEPLLFPQQATYCLSNGHALCPVYLTAQRAKVQRSKVQPSIASRTAKAGVGAGRMGETKVTASVSDNAPGEWQPVIPRKNTSISGEAASPQPTLAEIMMAGEPENEEESWLSDRQRWGWIGAGVVFIAVLLLGSAVAAYVGWQFANTQLAVRLPAVSIAEQVATTIPPPPVATYLFWTATPERGAELPQPPPVNNAPSGDTPSSDTANLQGQSTPTPLQFPPAVTATPGGQPVANTGDVIVVEPPNLAAVQVPLNVTPLVNVDADIPTRRPTPIGDVNINGISGTVGISNTLPLTPTHTATPAGTPVVIFGADTKILKPNGCTTVRWSVQNVKEVYYDNIGVNGTGEREECIRETSGEFILKVILPNGALQVYTTTVQVDLPTATPLPTYTFTPEVLPSPTWTPEPPTATPTPNVRRGVLLAVQGALPHACALNSACAIGLIATNTGDQIDSLVIQKVAGESWSAQLCRADGVCGGQLTISSVSPGNTAYVELRLTIPADASAGQSGAYQIVARSEGSGNTITSETVTVNVVVQ